ncbi:MAG: gephyrin-like molybdotransferase Glp [Pirellulales bacterium]
MITLDEALARVIAHAQLLRSSTVPLPEALDRVLAEYVVSDVDSPPHDKAMVDGFAVIAADLAGGEATLRIVDEVTAGSLPRCAVERGTTSRIMTGAPLPEGADAVVMVEYSNSASEGAVTLVDADVAPGRHITRRGAVMQRGAVVLSPGTQLRHAQIGLLAEVGKCDVAVIPPPRVAVLATGNELVPYDQFPGAGKLRNSNGPMLCSAVRRAGGVPLDLGIAADDRAVLVGRVREGLETDVLLLSGGVSAGVLDLVPGVLQEMGVREIFHKVALKPGKPLWFGVHEGAVDTGADSSGKPPTLVFGLPGNPVSSLVTFELIVRPAMSVLTGHGPQGLARVTAVLASDFAQRGERDAFYPAKVIENDGERLAEPIAWQGSADLRNLAGADGLIFFPAGDRTHAAGSEVTVLLF